MGFLRTRPGSRSPSCAWNNCIIPSKHIKTLKQGSSAEYYCFTPRDCKRPQWNKPFLNTSIFPRCTESRCTEKNQARSLMTSTHASVRCSILVFTDIRQDSERSVTTKWNNVHALGSFQYTLTQCNGSERQGENA